MAVLVLGFSMLPVYGQAGDVLKACEEVADKAKRLEIENTSLVAQLAIERERAKLYEERIAAAKAEAAAWESAYKKSKEVDSNSALIIFNLREQVADDKLRIRELEEENKKLRSSRTVRSIISFGAGVGTGFLINR